MLKPGSTNLKMDETMKQFQEGLIELETEAEHLLLARHQLVENDRVRNGNREALTALRKRVRTTKTSVPSPFESIMRDIGGPESKPLVKEVCTTCGNHDSNERTWIMFPGTDLIDQAQLDFDAKRLQSYMKEKSLLISERGAIADKISPGVLKSLITLSDKPKANRLCHCSNDCKGNHAGPNQPVILYLLDIEQAAESLNGISMELTDAAFPLLKDVVEACKDINIAVMLGGSPWKEITLRKNMLSTNASIYKAQALILEEHVAADCKVLVVANPANANALILKQFAPSMPKENITCLTRLDHNRALGQIADRLKVHVSDVKNVII
ncbi:uncharacterized protein LOC126710243 isoform X2 [Quercus robur]|uniref:uncharacterized protein LOC126710243 isoform X2 n=1 Tax=Quercus robur TaxID=38942 RepID=UPI00216245C7|nr:uncharacterized protein LOC126710243 isoform X2 [Quercus robur]